jgi:hypothetical protein
MWLGRWPHPLDQVADSEKYSNAEPDVKPDELKKSSGRSQQC